MTTPTSSTDGGARVAARAWPLAMLALYLLTPNRQYQLDALDYATAARSGVGLFHPHHLLYNAFGFVLVHLLPFIEPLRLLATANALITIASMVLLSRVIARWTGAPGLGRAVAIAYGLTHGIWYMATAVEVYPMALAAELVALTLLAGAPGQLDRAGSGRVLFAGVASGVAMLFHQTALFSVPAFAYLLWARGRRAAALGYVAVAGLVAAGAYLIVTWRMGVTTPLGFAQWITAYAHSTQFKTGTWGGGLSPSKMLGGFAGAGGALVAPAFVWNLQPFSGYRPGAGDLAPLVLILVAVGLAIALLWSAHRRARARAISDEESQLRRALLLWAAVHALFTLWWESVNFEFWLMLLPPIAVRAALTLRALDLASRDVRRKTIAALALFAVGNLCATFLPDTRAAHNGWRGVIATLERAGVQDGDLVLSNEPMVDSYNRYFGTHRLRVTSLRDTGGAPDAVARLGADVDAARANGHAWLLETETLDEYGGVPRAAVLAFWTPRLANAEVVGDYFAWGRRWHLYRLR